VRIFYGSDYDPAGVHMPIAFARQIEFWLRKFCPDADIALCQLFLTAEQVRHYKLPRKPALKKGDRRIKSFEQQYGKAVVELDALEALHAGALEQIVREAVGPYIDPDLEGNLQGAVDEAQEDAGRQWQEATADVREGLEQIGQEADEVLDDYRERIEDLQEQLIAINNELQERLAPLRERLAPPRPQGEDAGRRVEPEMPGPPEAE